MLCITCHLIAMLYYLCNIIDLQAKNLASREEIKRGISEGVNLPSVGRTLLSKELVDEAIIISGNNSLLVTVVLYRNLVLVLLQKRVSRIPNTSVRTTFARNHLALQLPLTYNRIRHSNSEIKTCLIHKAKIHYHTNSHAHSTTQIYVYARTFTHFLHLYFWFCT